MVWQTAMMRAGVPADFATLRDIDDDAALLFAQAGLELNLPDDHEFVRAELDHWQRSLAGGTAIIASDLQGRAIGFAAATRLDGAPYLAQLSVRGSHMRRGIGSALLREALTAAEKDGAAMWLTTYEHLPWNRAFYERHGFVCIAEQYCEDAIRGVLELERSSLPLPEKRVAMRRSF